MDQPVNTITLADLRAKVGQELGASSWLTVDQSMIDRFAGVTQDRQFIHIDPARAAATPFGGTIAHGFLTLSLLSHFAQQVLPRLEGLVMSINYGFDRVRFVAPVRSGARIRGVFKLEQLEVQASGRLQMRQDVTVEIDGETKPAISATWLSLLVPGPGTL
ncbi:MAG TPA: MaoC family dehydratase [Acidiphilium sp.]|nr:MAG: nodulation protein NodN [Acidiphilium sp. 21-60-14]OYV91785.1 MAG: nodulation protein NodN [Acidiphilium sp. 37-60-79]HQT89249.1 MaoC family dehydratase [Acidiphilium sp.]HQU24284.1 MaoC family dehydratase [Acidiphilium sp.]